MSEGASKQQGWAIYAHLGYDIRDAAMTYEEASRIIGLSMGGDTPGAIKLLERHGAIKKRDVKPKQPQSTKNKGTAERKRGMARASRTLKWAELHGDAHREAMRRASDVIPTPMIIEQHKNVFDDAEGGVCGMAWLKFDGRSAFAKYLVEAGFAHKHSDGGVTYHGYRPKERKWVQSYERQVEYARAYASVISKAGVEYEFFSRED